MDMSQVYSEVPADTGEATRDFQDRLGRYAALAFFISGVMLLARVASDLVVGGGKIIEVRSKIVHLTIEVILLVVWRLCRGKTLRATTIGALDAGLAIGLCIGWGLFTLDVAPGEPMEVMIILATTYTIIARSVMIPSAFGRTLWISALAVLPPIYSFVQRGMPFVSGGTPGRREAYLVFFILWCGMGVLTAGINSRQIYGLRQRIREIGKLGQYTLEEKIGEGGMGVVYRATHAMLRRPAAIKLLLPDRAGEQDLARFEREVQLTSRLSHPNTISIFDYGRTAQGVFYYVMEYLDGFDLQRIVDLGGPLEAPRVVRILEQAAGALSEAHALGLIHRDIKPANIILTARADEPDIAKVVDFGLVKPVNNAPGEISVTNLNAIVGTPLCLAPESITTPDSLDARSDLYSLGAVAYFLLTGRPVFEARTVVEMCSKHLTETPVPPSERLGKPISADLEAIVLACLAKRPADRPASAAALRSAILACADAERYDAAAARAWWSSEPAKLRARASAAPHSGHGSTMAIDLRGRSREQPVGASSELVLEYRNY
jgi:serine/threonine-protein kinase